MSAVLISIIAGAVIVGAMLLIVPLLNRVPKMTDHHKGLILLAVIFAIIGAIFGAYHGYGIVNGVIDALLLFVFVVAVGWLWARLRRTRS
jgi:hypothetical protein